MVEGSKIISMLVYTICVRLVEDEIIIFISVDKKEVLTLFENADSQAS